MKKFLIGLSVTFGIAWIVCSFAAIWANDANGDKWTMTALLCGIIAPLPFLVIDAEDL